MLLMDGLKAKINDVIEYNLENVESEDVSNVLGLIQQSFNISFKDQDFIDLKTFGDLCDLVHDKIILKHQADCTKQQAFYKLKKALCKIFEVAEDRLVPNAVISEIVPRKDRVRKLKLLDEELGMKLRLLSPPAWVTGVFVIVFFSSLLAFFFSWKIAIAGLALSFAGFGISEKLGKEIDIRTIGELTKKIASEHYLKSRSNSNTVNRAEVDGVIQSLFVEHLGLEPEKLDRDARFGK